MRKPILLLLLFLGMAFSAASHAQNSLRVLGSGEYIAAKARYSSGDYEGAYRLFHTLFLKYSDQSDLNYYLAMSAVKLGKNEEAVAAFERALIGRPEFHRARVEFARLLYSMGLSEEAQTEFETLLAADVPDSVKKRVRGYLAVIERNRKSSSGRGSFMLGYEVSDNVNYGLDENSYDLPGLNIRVDGERPESGSAHVERLGLYRFQRLKSYDNVRLNHRLVLYNKSLSKHDENDLQYLSFLPSLSFDDRRNRVRYHVGLGIDYIVPGDLSRDRFQVVTWTPGFTKQLNRHDYVTSYLKLQRILYDESVSHERDYERTEVGIGMRYENFSYLLRVARDQARRGERTDIDKSLFSNSLSYRYPLGREMAFEAGYMLTLQRYQERDLLFDSKRADDYHRLMATLSKAFDGRHLLTLSYRYTANDSNQAAYEYESNCVSLNYTRKFQW